MVEISFLCAQSPQTMTHPEGMAGRWEASDGQGGQVGMNILISTTVPSSASDLVDVPQYLESFDIGLYQRSGSNVNPLGFNFFSTSSNGRATWDGRRLRIDLTHNRELPEVHVDLTWSDAGKVWIGAFERSPFQNRAITLRRPAGVQKSPFAGTWSEGKGLMNNCVHIAQAEDGTFTGWGDDIQIPGLMRYANGLRPPERTMEHYGEIAKVRVSTPERIEVELRAYTPMCCSHSFTASISPGRELSRRGVAGWDQSSTAAGQVGTSARRFLRAGSQPSLEPCFRVHFGFRSVYINEAFSAWFSDSLDDLCSRSTTCLCVRRPSAPMYRCHPLIEREHSRHQ